MARKRPVGGTGVGGTLIIGVNVRVAGRAVAVGVCVSVFVGNGVDVDVAVAVGIDVWVGVFVGVLVDVGVHVGGKVGTSATSVAVAGGLNGLNAMRGLKKINP
jgi:hypothetical protein